MLIVRRLRRLVRMAAGHRDWLVHDVERGAIRWEQTRRSAQRWGVRWHAFNGDPELCFMVLPRDRCAFWGIDPEEPELYPGPAFDDGPA